MVNFASSPVFVKPVESNCTTYLDVESLTGRNVQYDMKKIVPLL